MRRKDTSGTFGTKAAMYPCKDCADRVPGKCYDTCSKYKAAKARHIGMKRYAEVKTVPYVPSK